MTTVIYGAEIDLNVQYFKDKLAITTDQVEREKLERQIAALEDAVVIYRLTPRQQQEIANGSGTSGL